MEEETIGRGVERLVFATSFGGEVVAQDEAVVKDGRAFFFVVGTATSALSVRQLLAACLPFFSRQDSTNILSSSVKRSH